VLLVGDSVRRLLNDVSQSLSFFYKFNLNLRPEKGREKSVVDDS